METTGDFDVTTIALQIVPRFARTVISTRSDWQSPSVYPRENPDAGKPLIHLTVSAVGGQLADVAEGWARQSCVVRVGIRSNRRELHRRHLRGLLHEIRTCAGTVEGRGVMCKGARGAPSECLGICPLSCIHVPIRRHHGRVQHRTLPLISASSPSCGAPTPTDER